LGYNGNDMEVESLPAPELVSDEWCLVKLSLVLGYYPQVVYLKEESRGGYLTIESSSMTDISFHPASLNQKNWKTRRGDWFIYTHAMMLSRISLFETTWITLPYILFAANSVLYDEKTFELHFDDWETRVPNELHQSMTILLNTRKQFREVCFQSFATSQFPVIGDDLRNNILLHLKGPSFSTLDICIRSSPLSMQENIPDYVSQQRKRKQNTLLSGFGRPQRFQNDRREYAPTSRGGYGYPYPPQSYPPRTSYSERNSWRY